MKIVYNSGHGELFYVREAQSSLCSTPSGTFSLSKSSSVKKSFVLKLWAEDPGGVLKFLQVIGDSICTLQYY